MRDVRFARDSVAGPLFRKDDPPTSADAARSISPDALCQRLLTEYQLAGPAGLTDEQAAFRANIEGGWKRCSDLRRMGLIEPTGERRPNRSGRDGMVCRRTIAPSPIGGILP